MAAAVVVGRRVDLGLMVGLAVVVAPAIVLPVVLELE